MISPAEWLALCLRTESELEHEWPALAWVVRNRVESGRYPSSYVRVQLSPAGAEARMGGF